MNSKRNCSKGYSCGSSCISKLKGCKKGLPEDISLSLDGSRTIIRKELKDPKGSPIEFDHKKDYRGDGHLYDPQEMKTIFREARKGSTDLIEIEGENISYGVGLDKAINPMLFREDRYQYLKALGWDQSKPPMSIFWDVNENFKPSTKSEKIKVALEARRMWSEVIKTIPEGTLLSNEPIGGAGGARDRAYQRQGFGAVGEYSESQYAIVKNGKLIPAHLENPNKKGHLGYLYGKAKKAY